MTGPTPEELRQRMKEKEDEITAKVAAAELQKAQMAKQARLETTHKAVKSGRESLARELREQLHTLIDNDKQKGRNGFDNFYSAYATILNISEALSKVLLQRPISGAEFEMDDTMRSILQAIKINCDGIENGDRISVRKVLNRMKDSIVLGMMKAPEIKFPNMEYNVELDDDNKVKMSFARADGQDISVMDVKDVMKFEDEFKNEVFKTGLEAWLLSRGHKLETANDGSLTVKNNAGTPLDNEAFTLLRDDPSMGLKAFLNPPDRSTNMEPMSPAVSHALRP